MISEDRRQAPFDTSNLVLTYEKREVALEEKVQVVSGEPGAV